MHGSDAERQYAITFKGKGSKAKWQNVIYLLYNCGNTMGRRLVTLIDGGTVRIKRVNVHKTLTAVLGKSKCSINASHYYGDTIPFHPYPVPSTMLGPVKGIGEV